jgi:hypothetical protein
MNTRFFRWVDYFLIALGGFLIIDRLMLHYIRFDYNTIGLAWIDPFFDHWMIGVFLIIVALMDLKKLRV